MASSSATTGTDRLPTLSSEWYVPSPSSPSSANGNFDHLGGGHRVRHTRRRSSVVSEEDEDENISSHHPEDDGEREGLHYSGSDDESSVSGSSDSDMSDSEEEFYDPYFDAADTGVERKWRRLSLTRTNAPLEGTPSPPPPTGENGEGGCGGEKEKAETSARFYAEAYLTGIPPAHADRAARDVDGRFRRWWGRLQARKGSSASCSSSSSCCSGSMDGGSSHGGSGSSSLSSSSHGGELCPNGSSHGMTLTIARRRDKGGWAHYGDAAVTASLVPELKPRSLPTVESIFGSVSTGPVYPGDLHSLGLGMKNALDSRLGINLGQEGDALSASNHSSRSSAPSMMLTTGQSTPTSAVSSSAPAPAVLPASLRASFVDAAVSESEAEGPELADVFDDDDDDNDDQGIRPAQQQDPMSQQDISASRKKRTRGDLGCPSSSAPPQTHNEKDELSLPAATLVSDLSQFTQVTQLEALCARVCSPEPPVQVIEASDGEEGHEHDQFADQEFQDAFDEDPFGEGEEDGHVADGHVAVPFSFDETRDGGVADPFDEDCCSSQQQAQAQAPQGQRRYVRGHAPQARGVSVGPDPLSSDEEGPAASSAAAPPSLFGCGLYQTPSQVIHSRRISDAKADLLRHLSTSGGDVTSELFLASLAHLRSLAEGAGLDMADYAADSSTALEGMWLTLSRPNYHDCLGKNVHRTGGEGGGGGEYMYTLGRMSFDMFRPTGLVCSVQGVFAPCHRVDGRNRDDVDSVPRSLRRELRDGETCLRTYNIVTAFTIEPPSPAYTSPDDANDAVVRPIRGIMTTYGYVLPDPETPNRLSVWFTGGTLECNDDEADGDEWKRIFCGDDEARGRGSCADQVPGAADTSSDSSSNSSNDMGSSGRGGGGALPKRQHLGERARVLAAKLLLGAVLPERMEDDGTMSFSFRRPIGGHGTTYIDVLYLDETLRILRGHHGTVYVFARVPSAPES